MGPAGGVAGFYAGHPVVPGTAATGETTRPLRVLKRVDLPELTGPTMAICASASLI